MDATYQYRWAAPLFTAPAHLLQANWPSDGNGALNLRVRLARHAHPSGTRHRGATTGGLRV